ncbi:hypothetical protein BAE44_0001060 [Dichanthelium oligosanthes]|uniref:Uncharacterized protein n=1 Tax=Dichanthelium oligosanthes TaxID=888268 RepID=A0A1E5WKH0_9POAL|nr:hypothetical protein BAE44_0001060 [Dichanthelium oligosanthes]
MSSGAAAAGSAADYTAAATVVRFDPPLPLLRAPLPSPAPGEPPLLAFRDAASWEAAWDAAEASLVSQCEVIIPLTTPSPFLGRICVGNASKF